MPSKVECDIVRPKVNFSKNIWRDHFPSSPSTHLAFESLTKEIDPLKMKVKEMLMGSAADPTENIKFIDTLLRLGVSYHFENDIEKQLETIFNSQENLLTWNAYDLNTTSIVFRVFRQHGFKMSCGVFDKFKDNVNGKFEKTLIMADVRGILSLYEAAYLRVHGESILEEALAFTKANLKPLAMKSSPHLAKQIDEALDHPLNKRPSRLEARRYISFYEKVESVNETVLQFAKLDFNRLQLLYQQEISELARFWKDYNFSSELPYARERYVEVYLWINSLFFEPQYGYWRVIISKILTVISILDDSFDAYGTPEELQRFMDTLKRWEIGAVDELQDYTKVIYKAVLDLFGEIDDGARKQGKSFATPYLKDAFIRLMEAYHAEVKWCHKGHVPTFEEYMSVARKTSTFETIIAISFVGMETVSGSAAFEWLKGDSRIMTAVDLIGRMMDDIASHEFEQSREHCPSCVECYMKQHDLSEKATLEAFEEKLEDAWKDVNEECMRPTEVPRDLLLRPLNFARASYLCYKHGDGYTHPEYIKDDIHALFVDPVPI